MEPSFDSRLDTELAPRSKPRPVSREAHGLNRILVCVDRSNFAEASLKYAVALAKTFGSDLTLLHVMQPPQEGGGLRTTSALGWEVQRQEAATYLARLKEQATLASGRDVETKLEQGHAAERITGVARETHADLTVLGSHGEDAKTAWNLGSTVQQVLAVTRGSVLVARSPVGGGEVTAPRRILVPLDGSLRTESVLPIATRIARAHDAELLLVHVVAEPLPTALLRSDEDMALARELARRVETHAHDYLDHMREQLAGEVSGVRTLVLRNADERQSLLELSEREHVDLVVLSAHGSTCNAARSFGSVAAHLIAHSMIPLLVLQDLPAFETPDDASDDERAPPLRSSYPPGDS